MRSFNYRLTESNLCITLLEPVAQCNSEFVISSHSTKNKPPYMNYGSVVYNVPQRWKSGKQRTAIKGLHTRPTCEHPACKYNFINVSAAVARYACCCALAANLPAHVCGRLLNTGAPALLALLLANCLCSVWRGASRPQVCRRHQRPSPRTTEPPTIALAGSLDIHSHQMLALISRMQLHCGIVYPSHNSDRQQ